MDEDCTIVPAASATGMSQSQPGDHQADVDTTDTDWWHISTVVMCAMIVGIG